MEKEANKRRIPTGDGIMNDKKFNDLVYSYLQCISDRRQGEHDRYLFKSRLNKSRAAKNLRMNLRTFYRKFDHLVDKGYIVETEDTYELPKISEYNFYIPYETLQFLVDVSNEDVISVYSYLGQLQESLRKEKGEKKTSPYFTISRLLIIMNYKIKNGKDKDGNQLWAPSKHTRDWERMNNIISSLVNHGLLSYKTVYYTSNGIQKPRHYYTISTNFIDNRK